MQPVGFKLSIEDIKELQEQLAQSRQRERALELRVEELSDFMENVSMPLHWVDGHGVISWANQAELDLLGYAKEEYVGCSISDFHADATVIRDILSRLGDKETLQNYPARLKCRDGSIKHVLINTNVLWQEGKFMHTRCITRDITDTVAEENRRAELLRQLEQSEVRLLMAMEATGLGTWDYNPVSGQLSWSDECKKIY
ncbi:MAG TPA: PAS domain-containing protein, partial [Flavitalea sp.]|nr:PAS domain-containing protein [Flavitalea sp.]